MTEKDYVLGTHDEEIARLGLQHEVWRERVLQLWERAGIEPGTRVVDVGAGPGYGTLELAHQVGREGEVVALERSGRFVTHGTAQVLAHRYQHVQFIEHDVLQPFPCSDMEASWCRWVASFVTSPGILLDNIAAALRPGGVAMFHEYADYGSWRLLPRRPMLEDFVGQVMESWREAGGEPDIALQLPAMLEARGFRITHLEPVVWVLEPKQPAWRWLASFIEVGPQRLLELGRVDAAWVAQLHAELRAAEREPGTRMITPMVFEILAEKI